MRGDIILFASVGSWTDRIIEWGTRGKFVHVEIDLGGGLSIGEHTAGLLIHKTPTQPGIVLVPLKNSPASEIEAGLKWATDFAARPLEKREYGWLDIAADALKIIGLPHVPGIPSQMDCSDFVYQYLNRVGAVPKAGRGRDPATVSPNDLARMFGIPTK